MRIHPFYIKLLAEALIPLLGFFAWGWGLYFILLFYLLDLFAAECVQHLKTAKIKRYNEKVETAKWWKFGLLSALGFGAVAIAIHLGMKFYQPEIDFWKEVIGFLSYTDMGVAQGYILLPLVAFMAYTTYQTEFIRPKVYQVQNYEVMWKAHITEYGLLLTFVVLVTGLGRIFTLSEAWMLITILLGIIGFKWFEARRKGIIY